MTATAPFELFGPAHCAIIMSIPAFAAGLTTWARQVPVVRTPVRFVIGSFLAVNEVVWYVFKFSHEGGVSPRVSRYTYAISRYGSRFWRVLRSDRSCMNSRLCRHRRRDDGGVAAGPVGAAVFVSDDLFLSGAWRRRCGRPVLDMGGDWRARGQEAPRALSCCSAFSRWRSEFSTLFARRVSCTFAINRVARRCWTI